MSTAPTIGRAEQQPRITSGGLLGLADAMHEALSYFNACWLRERPEFVPCRIKLEADVHGDFPSDSTVAKAGEHDCDCNQWGAVSVRASNGKMLGIKPKEFSILKFRPNNGGQISPR